MNNQSEDGKESSINIGNYQREIQRSDSQSQEIYNISQIERRGDDATFCEAQGSFEIEDYIVNDMTSNNLKSDTHLFIMHEQRRSLD